MLLINAEKRELCGTKYSKRLRKYYNKIPGIIYGSKKSTIYISLDHNSILNLQNKSGFYKNEIILVISNIKYFVYVKDIQFHAFKLQILHIDFLYKK